MQLGLGLLRVGAGLGEVDVVAVARDLAEARRADEFGREGAGEVDLVGARAAVDGDKVGDAVKRGIGVDDVVAGVAADGDGADRRRAGLAADGDDVVARAAGDGEAGVAAVLALVGSLDRDGEGVVPRPAVHDGVLDGAVDGLVDRRRVVLVGDRRGVVASAEADDGRGDVRDREDGAVVAGRAVEAELIDGRRVDGLARCTGEAGDDGADARHVDDAVDRSSGPGGHPCRLDGCGGLLRGCPARLRLGHCVEDAAVRDVEDEVLVERPLPDGGLLRRLVGDGVRRLDGDAVVVGAILHDDRVRRDGGVASLGPLERLVDRELDGVVGRAVLVGEAVADLLDVGASVGNYAHRGVVGAGGGRARPLCCVGRSVRRSVRCGESDGSDGGGGGFGSGLGGCGVSRGCGGLGGFDGLGSRGVARGCGLGGCGVFRHGCFRYGLGGDGLLGHGLGRYGLGRYGLGGDGFLGNGLGGNGLGRHGLGRYGIGDHGLLGDGIGRHGLCRDGIGRHGLCRDGLLGDGLLGRRSFNNGERRRGSIIL